MSNNDAACAFSLGIHIKIYSECAHTNYIVYTRYTVHGLRFIFPYEFQLKSFIFFLLFNITRAKVYV